MNDATGAYEIPRSFDQPGSPGVTGAFDPPASFGEQASFGRQDAGGRAPLPRRVRRASLAPQLRDDGPFAAPTPEAEDTLVAWEERSAEASRDLFASLQAGWLRGRAEDEGPSDNWEKRGPSS